MMNEATRCRAALGEAIATAYAHDRMLLALNHVYLPEPRLKWREHFLPALSIRPVDIVERMERLYQVEPVVAVQELQQLFDETLDLVDQHLPRVETGFARQWYQHRRVQWDHAPVLL